MTLFIVLLVIMLVVALIILLPTLLKPATANINDSLAQAVVYRDKLRELESDRDNGTLTEDEYQQAFKEVEGEALSVMDGGHAAADNSRPQKTTAIVVALFLPVIVAGIYLQLGTWQLVDRELFAMDMAGMQNGQASIEEMIGRLEQRLASKPDDVEGWELLGHTYRKIGRPVEAASAYRRAIELGANLQATLEQVLTEEPAPVSAQQSMPTLPEMVEKLVAHVKENPQDTRAWAILGKLYSVQNDMPNAVKAYQRASEMTTDNADLWADYADALASANDHQLSGKPLEMILRALSLNPKHPKALWLAGAEAHMRNDLKAAIKYWQRLLAVTDPNSDDVRIIRGNIEEAARLSGIPLADVLPELKTASSIRSIRGMVRLDDKLRAGVPEDAIVFVYAKAKTGPQMPLAVVRKSVNELPFSFVLDDTMAMMPKMKLSSVDDVVISTHISRSGSAKRQPGDLQADAQLVAKGSDSLLRFTINKLVP
ncbi:MAG: hypothetical protein BMS9Abin26_0471 [Gammaproteobacteria bacterium]|nr:MAG: hypothetical protein BMS9Abin26_0471 [Gammaproteobacteria bacterium]